MIASAEVLLRAKEFMDWLDRPQRKGRAQRVPGLTSLLQSCTIQFSQLHQLENNSLSHHF